MGHAPAVSTHDPSLHRYRNGLTTHPSEEGHWVTSFAHDRSAHLTSPAPHVPPVGHSVATSATQVSPSAQYKGRVGGHTGLIVFVVFLHAPMAAHDMPSSHSAAPVWHEIPDAQLSPKVRHEPSGHRWGKRAGHGAALFPSTQSVAAATHLPSSQRVWLESVHGHLALDSRHTLSAHRYGVSLAQGTVSVKHSP